MKYNMTIFEKIFFLILLLGSKNFDRKPPRAKFIKSKIYTTKSCLKWPTTTESEVQYMISQKMGKSTYTTAQLISIYHFYAPSSEVLETTEILTTCRTFNGAPRHAVLLTELRDRALCVMYFFTPIYTPPY